MSAPDGENRRAWSRTLGVAAAVLGAIVIVLLFDPLGAIASAIPWPGVPDLPDPPGWVRWAWRALMVSAVVLAVLGAVEQDRKSKRKPSRDRVGDNAHV